MLRRHRRAISRDHSSGRKRPRTPSPIVRRPALTQQEVDRSTHQRRLGSAFGRGQRLERAVLLLRKLNLRPYHAAATSSARSLLRIVTGASPRGQP